MPIEECVYCLASGKIGKPKLDTDTASYTHQVICEECGAGGPITPGSCEAVDAWNEWSKFQSANKDDSIIIKKAPK